MSTVITVRDVPDEVRDALARQARDAGQSLQAFTLALLRRQASFSRNASLLDDIDRELVDRPGAPGTEAPDASALLVQARGEAEAPRL